MIVELIEKSNPVFPNKLSAIPGKNAFKVFYILGNSSLLLEPWLALFCSSKCPGSLILQAYDLSMALQMTSVPLASGFHSPAEQDTLKMALRGEQKILISPARGLEGMRIPVECRKPLGNGRLILASMFPPKLKRPTAEIAYERNRFVAALAEKVLVIHAEAGGKLAALCQEILAWGKPLYTLESEHNRALIEMGAQIYCE
jgi:predicted Rossmann fold nucleotide-binding protein DprA/Smf involved in DNA uptake